MAALVVLILAVPAWLLADVVRDFIIRTDDFDYIAWSRDAAATRAHLFEPHNVHVVPIFRIGTFALIRIAGRLQYLPSVLGVASFMALVAEMAVLGYLVARETGQPATAMGAMAVLGISTVSYPAVTWFAASQAIWAGAASLLTVTMARAWAERGGAARLGAVAAGAILAPAIWSGGLVAGPASIAYLLARRTPRSGRPVLLAAVGTAAAALIIVVISRNYVRTNVLVWSHSSLWPRPIQAVLHTAQALVEACLFGNLGIEATTTPGQAAALLAILVALHAVSRGGVGRFSPLEAVGAMIAVGGALITYGLRGNMSYSSLRPATWYHAIPQLGAVLFVAGWWAASRPGDAGRMSRRQAVGVAGLLVAACLVHIPGLNEKIIAAAPAFVPGEETIFITPELRLARALYYRNELHARQVRALARLDRLDRILARTGTSPRTLRDAFGHVRMLGMVQSVPDIDVFDILIQRPRSEPTIDALAEYHFEIIELLRPDPDPSPPWLQPDNPRPKAIRDVSKPPPPGIPVR